jgi:hypothetical protein
MNQKIHYLEGDSYIYANQILQFLYAKIERFYEIMFGLHLE